MARTTTNTSGGTVADRNTATTKSNKLADFPTSARKLSADIDSLEKASSAEFKSMKKKVENELDKLEKRVKDAD